MECGADMTVRSNLGRTILSVCDEGHVEYVRGLAELGFDMDLQDADGETALHVFSFGGEVDAVRALAEVRADVNARDHGGWTPLHVCSRKGQVEVACALAAARAEMNARADHGTALDFARTADVAAVFGRHRDTWARQNPRPSPWSSHHRPRASAAACRYVVSAGQSSLSTNVRSRSACTWSRPMASRTAGRLNWQISDHIAGLLAARRVRS